MCGDDLDLINGQPTGCVRISFGFMSTMDDVLTLIQFIENNFIEGRPRRNPHEEYKQFVKRHEQSSLLKNEKDLNRILTQRQDSKNANQQDHTKVLSTNQNSLPKKENGARLVPQEMVSSNLSTNQEGGVREEVTSDSGEANHISSTESQDGIVLDRIFVYPVKSCAGFEVWSLETVYSMLSSELSFDWFVAFSG